MKKIIYFILIVTVTHTIRSEPNGKELGEKQKEKLAPTVITSEFLAQYKKDLLQKIQAYNQLSNTLSAIVKGDPSKQIPEKIIPSWLTFQLNSVRTQILRQTFGLLDVAAPKGISNEVALKQLFGDPKFIIQLRQKME